MIIKGKAHKYGDHVNTDVIIPGRYLHYNEAADLGRYCLEDLDGSFAKKVKPGDVIMGGINFGCGSSREQAPLAIKGSGTACIVAKGFARIFFRNAINMGLPILECSEAVDGTDSGDSIEIDLSSGIIKNITEGAHFQARPFPEFVIELVKAGGLVEYTRRKLAQ